MKTLNFEEMEVVQGGWGEQMLETICGLTAMYLDSAPPGDTAYGPAFLWYQTWCV